MHLNMQFLTIILSIFLLGSVSAAPAVVLPSSVSLPPAPTIKGAPVPPGKDGQAMGPKKDDPVVDVLKGFHFFLDNYEKKKNLKAPSERKSNERARAFLKDINFNNWRRMSPEEREVAWKKAWDRENRERGQDMAVQTKFMYDFATKLQQNTIKKQGKSNPRLEKFIKSPVFAKENMLPALEVLKKRAVPVEPTPLTEEQRQIMSNKLAESMHKHENSQHAVQSADDDELRQHEHIGKNLKKVARALQGPDNHRGEEVKQNELTDPEKYFKEKWENHGPGKDDMTAAQRENTNGPPGTNGPPPNPEAYAKEQWYTHHWGENPVANRAGHLSREQKKAAKAVRGKSLKLQSKSGSKVDHVKGKRLWDDMLMSLRELRTNHHEVLNKTNAPFDAKDPSSTWNDTRASSKPLATVGSERQTLLPRALENDKVLEDGIAHGTPKDNLPPAAYGSPHKPNDTVLETLTGNAIKSEPELQKRDDEVEDERPTLPRLPKRDGVQDGKMQLPCHNHRGPHMSIAPMCNYFRDSKATDQKSPTETETGGKGPILPKLPKRDATTPVPVTPHPGAVNNHTSNIDCPHNNHTAKMEVAEKHKQHFMEKKEKTRHQAHSREKESQENLEEENLEAEKLYHIKHSTTAETGNDVTKGPHKNHIARLEVFEKHTAHSPSQEQEEMRKHEGHDRGLEQKEKDEEEMQEWEKTHKIRHDGSKVASRNSTSAGTNLQSSLTTTGPHLNHTVMQEIGERQQKVSPTKVIDVNDGSDVGPWEEPLLRKRGQATDHATWQHARVWKLCHDDFWRIHHFGKNAPSICQKIGHGDPTIAHLVPSDPPPEREDGNRYGMRKRGLIPEACLVPWDGSHPGHNPPAGCAELIREHQGHDAAKEKAEEHEKNKKPLKTQTPDKTLIFPRLRTTDVIPNGLSLKGCLSPHNGVNHTEVPGCVDFIAKHQKHEAAKEMAEERQRQREQQQQQPERIIKAHATDDPDNHFPSSSEQKPSETQTADKTLILPKLRTREVNSNTLTLEECLAPNDGMDHPRATSPECKEMIRKLQEDQAVKEKAEEQEKLKPERNKKFHATHDPDNHYASNPEQKPSETQTEDRTPLMLPTLRKREAMPKLALADCLPSHQNGVIDVRIMPSGCQDVIREHGGHDAAQEKAEERWQEKEQQRQELERKRKLHEEASGNLVHGWHAVKRSFPGPHRLCPPLVGGHTFPQSWCRPRDDVVGGSGAHSNHTGATEIEERRQLEDEKNPNEVVGSSGAHSNHTGAMEIEELRQLEIKKNRRRHWFWKFRTNRFEDDMKKMDKLSKRLWFPDHTKEEVEEIVKSIKEPGKGKDIKVELEKYRKAHPDDKAARRFHYEKDENAGKTAAAAHERRHLDSFHWNPVRFNYTSGFNHLGHKVQHEDKFNKLSKRRNLLPQPHLTEQELKELEAQLRDAFKNSTRKADRPRKPKKEKTKWQALVDWMREHERQHNDHSKHTPAQEQRDRDATAQLNNHAGHRPDVEHSLTNNNHSDHSRSQEKMERVAWLFSGHNGRPPVRERAEVEEMGPVRARKRWVRHSLMWSSVERPTIHEVPVAAPSPAPDASTTPAARA